MKTIAQLLKTKGNNVWTINPDASIYEALQLMAEKNIGALVVLKDDMPVGIISERDYARKGILDGITSRDTPVSKIMVSRIICIKSTSHIDEAMALMSDKRIRHLPVVEDEKLLGIVSIGDLVTATIEEQKFTIEQLTHYING